jgi:hypothetical protein
MFNFDIYSRLVRVDRDRPGIAVDEGSEKAVGLARSSRIQITLTEAKTLMHESRLNVHRLIAVSAVCLTLVALPAAAKLRVGDHYRVTIDSARDYRGTSTGEALVWEHDLVHPGATYIAVHFKDFQLAPGDRLVVSDAEGGQSYTLTGKGKLQLGTFWSQHVKGDTARLQLFSNNPFGEQGFVIDEYVGGFIDLGGQGQTEAICLGDDKENAICYESSHPNEYNKARAVARLLIQGSSLCTGWLASASSHLITNEHCITSATAALNTEYEFMSEAATCGAFNCLLCHPGTVYTAAEFIQDSAALDYALVRLNADPAGIYGHLVIDPRDAVVGEQIYIPQHPGGRAKELAIFSTSDSGGVCEVFSITRLGCSSGAYFDVGYYCDTEGGSSGSPVLATSNHKVIALHHCANCPNRGVPIDLVYAEVSSFLGPECETDPDCVDGVFCNGVETCVGGSCLKGADPCPGEICNEASNSCSPIVCDNDGTCETGEDCGSCSGDCVAGTYAVCGDGTCDPDAGEDCRNCRADCNGKTGGKPSSRYCCGAETPCADRRCDDGSRICESGGGEPYCCGDSACEGGENNANCAIDCPDTCTPNETGFCNDALDNDCDQDVDCADADCNSDTACQSLCLPTGQACSKNADCCSNLCRGKGGNKTCQP